MRPVVALVLGLVLVSGVARAGEMLHYAGATTLQRYFMPKAALLFKGQTGVRLHIAGGNTDPGISALLAGQVDLAGAGRFLRQDETDAGLVGTLVGWDSLVIVAHQANAVENLDLDQLQGIFSGRISNWSEVGGADEPILVVTHPAGSGMRDAVEQEILRGLPLTPLHLVSSVVEDADLQVAMFPLAITAVSRSMVDSAEVKLMRVGGHLPTAETILQRRYPLAKPLLLVTRGVPAGQAGEFVSFVLSDTGQDIMARRFCPLTHP